MKLTQKLRQAIADNGGVYRLARLTKTNPFRINRFLKGRGTLTLLSVEKIADLLGLELREKS